MCQLFSREAVVQTIVPKKSYLVDPVIRDKVKGYMAVPKSVKFGLKWTFSLGNVYIDLTE